MSHSTLDYQNIEKKKQSGYCSERKAKLKSPASIMRVVEAQNAFNG